MTSTYRNFRITIHDDVSFVRTPYSLLFGLPCHYDAKPLYMGKWWTVTIHKSSHLPGPMTFYFKDEAKAALLIEKFNTKANELSSRDAKRLPSVAE
jgi:hypothetical protein